MVRSIRPLVHPRGARGHFLSGQARRWTCLVVAFGLLSALASGNRPVLAEQLATSPTDGEQSGTSPTDGEQSGTSPTDGEQSGTSPTDGDQSGTSPTDGDQRASILAKPNLVAWCIVPFDAKRRGPVERAEMLRRLGLQRLAYDWRQPDVETFEQEIQALREHGIEFFAFWSAHEKMFELFQKYQITPQVWITNLSPPGESQQQRVEAAGRQLLPLVKRTAQLGCELGLYNHGGWGGEPENLIAVCQWLREHADGHHVGIVYNFHHGHDHIKDFPAALAAMKPWLLCLNLNGMNTGANPKILPIGAGEHERAMIQAVRESGYRGPIGILDHRSDVDAERSLQENLQGLADVLKQLGDERALRTYDR